MTAKIEFRTTRDLYKLSQLIFDIKYALGISEYNKNIVEIGQKGEDEVYDLILHFPLTIEQERIIKMILHSDRYDVYWSELYN